MHKKKEFACRRKRLFNLRTKKGGEENGNRKDEREGKGKKD
jgi:hypothetical protein